MAATERRHPQVLHCRRKGERVERIGVEVQRFTWMKVNRVTGSLCISVLVFLHMGQLTYSTAEESCVNYVGMKRLKSAEPLTDVLLQQTLELSLRESALDHQPLIS